MRNSFRETNASGEGGYNERLYSPSKRAVSSRASNGNSTDRSRISFTPSHILDVTNTAWTTSQLKEVFDALSINSGCATNSRGRGIDKLEMMAYFQQCHDDMGVLDSSKKFERLIDSNTKSKDGLISFDEFAVIMLKIAQW